jgi:hypothetical protein
LHRLDTRKAKRKMLCQSRVDQKKTTEKSVGIFLYISLYGFRAFLSKFLYIVGIHTSEQALILDWELPQFKVHSYTPKLIIYCTSQKYSIHNIQYSNKNVRFKNCLLESMENSKETMTIK